MRTKQDKIFDNKFHESEYQHDISLKFDLNPSSSNDLEEDIHFKILFDEVDTIIKESKYKHLVELDENMKVKKLNKVQINEIYTLIIKNIKLQYKRMEIFDILSDYFDIFPAKFYNSLSNVFKDELMMELDASADILNSKGIRKLF